VTTLILNWKATTKIKSMKEAQRVERSTGMVCFRLMVKTSQLIKTIIEKNPEIALS
jgi:hypothetical protein